MVEVERLGRFVERRHDHARNGATGTGGSSSALEWASTQHKRMPGQNTLVVLVTDGQANGCDEDIKVISKLASDALAADGTRTYAIGLTGSNYADMNAIAMAGGTEIGILVTDGADTQRPLLDAFGNIRGRILDCDFPMPVPKAGMEVDPRKIFGRPS